MTNLHSRRRQRARERERERGREGENKSAAAREGRIGRKSRHSSSSAWNRFDDRFRRDSRARLSRGRLASRAPCGSKCPVGARNARESAGAARRNASSDFPPNWKSGLGDLHVPRYFLPCCVAGRPCKIANANANYNAPVAQVALARGGGEGSGGKGVGEGEGDGGGEGRTKWTRGDTGSDNYACNSSDAIRDRRLITNSIRDRAAISIRDFSRGIPARAVAALAAER